LIRVASLRRELALAFLLVEGTTGRGVGDGWSFRKGDEFDIGQGLAFYHSVFVRTEQIRRR